MSVYLRAEFEVCSVSLASFRQGVILSLTTTTAKRTLNKPSLIRLNRGNQAITVDNFIFHLSGTSTFGCRETEAYLHMA